MISSASVNRVPGETAASLGYVLRSRWAVETCVACTGALPAPTRAARSKQYCAPSSSPRKARCHTPLPIHDERAGKRNAPELLARFTDGRAHTQIGQHRRILAVRPERLFDDGVQDPVAPDGGRADIRQEWKADRVALGEVSQDLLGVVADSCYTDPCLRSSSRRLCSSTSCVRQNGHQSAERKNTSIAPRGPMTDAGCACGRSGL